MRISGKVYLRSDIKLDNISEFIYTYIEPTPALVVVGFNSNVYLSGERYSEFLIDACRKYHGDFSPPKLEDGWYGKFGKYKIFENKSLIGNHAFVEVFNIQEVTVERYAQMKIEGELKAKEIMDQIILGCELHLQKRKDIEAYFAQGGFF